MKGRYLRRFTLEYGSMGGGGLEKWRSRNPFKDARCGTCMMTEDINITRLVEIGNPIRVSEGSLLFMLVTPIHLAALQ